MFSLDDSRAITVEWKDTPKEKVKKKLEIKVNKFYQNLKLKHTNLNLKKSKNIYKKKKLRKFIL